MQGAGGTARWGSQRVRLRSGPLIPGKALHMRGIVGCPLGVDADGRLFFYKSTSLTWTLELRSVVMTFDCREPRLRARRPNEKLLNILYIFIYLPKFRTGLCQFSTRYRGAQLWNSFTVISSQSSTLKSFQAEAQNPSDESNGTSSHSLSFFQSHCIYTFFLLILIISCFCSFHL